jgi:hypothetical protein
MARRACVISLLGLCLGLAMTACKSGPSPSGPDETALAARKAGHIEGLLVQRPQASGVLAALITNLPDRVWLTDVTYDSGNVRTKGIAPSNIVLSDYISRLVQSPALSGVALAGSVVKTLQGYQWVEFSLAAAARVSGSGAAPSASSATDRLAELEKSLGARPASAGMLRDFHRLASEAGIQMTGYTPSAEVPGEFTAGLPVAIALSGGCDGLVDYLRGLAALPALWVVEKLSLKSASPDDPRSPVRASVSARAYFPL